MVYVHGYGLYSYGLSNYGLYNTPTVLPPKCSHDLYNYDLHNYDLYSYGLHNTPTVLPPKKGIFIKAAGARQFRGRPRCTVTAYVVMVHVIFAYIVEAYIVIADARCFLSATSLYGHRPCDHGPCN